MRNNTVAFVLSCFCAFVLAACGVDNSSLSTGPECRLNSDCEAGRVCSGGRCAVPASCVANCDGGSTSNGTNWVARSGAAHNLELSAFYTSNALCAALVGDAPLAWDSGNAVRRTESGSRDEYYYVVPLNGLSQTLGSGRYRASYVGSDSCGSNLPWTNVSSWRWADYGGALGKDMSTEARTWLCQYRDPRNSCVSSVFYDYNASSGAVTAAGVSECQNRPHDAGCPNLH